MAILCGLLTILSASSCMADPRITKEDLQNKLTAINEEIPEASFEIMDIKDSKALAHGEPLKFDTVEEFESFIKELSKPIEFEAQALHLENDIQPWSNTEMITISSEKFVSSIKKEYALYVDLKYQYAYINGNAFFVSLDELVSYIGGTSSFEWTETMYDAYFTNNFLPHDVLNLDIKGYLTFSVEVAGLTVNTNISQEWNITYRA